MHITVIRDKGSSNMSNITVSANLWNVNRSDCLLEGIATCLFKTVLITHRGYNTHCDNVISQKNICKCLCRATSCFPAMQGQTAVTAHLESKQLLLFDFAKTVESVTVLWRFRSARSNCPLSYDNQTIYTSHLSRVVYYLYYNLAT